MGNASKVVKRRFLIQATLKVSKVVEWDGTVKSAMDIYNSIHNELSSFYIENMNIGEITKC